MKINLIPTTASIVFASFLMAAPSVASAQDFLIEHTWWMTLPDLTCVSVRYADTAPGEYIVRVTNDGNAASPSTWLDVFASSHSMNVAYGDLGYDYVRMKPLAPGQSIEYHFYYPEYVVEAVIDDAYPTIYNACLVDTFEAVTEWNETDNHYRSYRQILPAEHDDWRALYGL